NGAIRPPFLAKLHKLFRGGKFSAAKNSRETFANAVIINRPNVGPAKIKKQKHLDGPPANAANLCETQDDLLIAHSSDRASGWHRTVDRFRGQILDCRNLAAGKTSRTKTFVGRRQNFFRIERFPSRVECAYPTKAGRP